MIEMLLNIGLFWLASSSRRNSKLRQSRCNLLEQEIEEKEAQIMLLTAQLEELSSEVQMALREKEKEWTGRMSLWKEETLRIGSVLRGEVRKLEAELGNLKQPDLGLNIVRVQELKDQRFVLPEKIAVREAQKLDLRSARTQKGEGM